MNSSIPAIANHLSIFAQQDDGPPAILMIVYLALIVLVFAGLWKTFAKAGEPGWAAIIPIYNIIVLMRIAGKPLWWVILFFIPIVSIVIAVLVSINIAKNFGKGEGFGLGLAFLGFIFYPILGFGDARFRRVV
jgi:hypothetical protein